MTDRKKADGGLVHRPPCLLGFGGGEEPPSSGSGEISAFLRGEGGPVT